MVTRPSRAASNVDALLNTLSPSEVAKAIRSYASRLSPNDVVEIAGLMLPKMDGFERAQLGIAFDAPRPTEGASSFDEPSIGEEELIAQIRVAGATSPERFARFLSQNVRSLGALDSHTLRAIFQPVSYGSAKFAPFRPTPERSRKTGRSGASATVAAVGVLAIAAAAYGVTHRIAPARSSVPKPITTPAVLAQRVTAPAVLPHVVQHPQNVPKAVPTATPQATAAANVTASPAPTPSATPTDAPTAAPSAAPSPTAIANLPSPAPSIPFPDRANDAVLYYLRSTQQRNSQFRILHSEYDGRVAHVVVSIDGPDGNFLGEYTVLARGSRIDIVDQNLSRQ